MNRDIDFLSKIPKTQATKAKIDKWDYVPIRYFYIPKETNRMGKCFQPPMQQRVNVQTI